MSGFANSRLNNQSRNSGTKRFAAVLCALLVCSFFTANVTAQSGTTEKPRSPDPYFASAKRSEKMPVVRQGSQTKIPGRRLPQAQSAPAPAKSSLDEALSKYQVTGYHGLEGSAQNAFEEGHVLAVVGGEPIFVGDVMFDANQLLQKFMPGAPEEIKNAERRKMLKRLLPKFIDEKLLLLHVKRGLPDPAAFDQIIEQAAEEFDEKAMKTLMEKSGAKSAIEFDAQLRAQGSSLRQMRRKWSEDQLVRFFIVRDMKSEASVTHHALLDYYRENISEFESPGRARWEQVMVRFDRIGSHSGAQESIVEIGNKIVYGANFAEIARKHSHGFQAADGGAHDWTTQGSLVSKELDQAIFSLPLNVLSDVIETDKGLHIIRVVERENASVVQFRDAQIEIRKKLEQQKRTEAFEEKLAKLRRETPVEVFELPSEKTRVSDAKGGRKIR